MHRTATTSHSGNFAGLPRGWTIAGLALISWVLLAGMWIGAAQLFGFVVAAL